MKVLVFLFSLLIAVSVFADCDVPIEGELGVNQCPYFMSIYGTDITVDGNPILPDDTLTVKYNDCLIGARLFCDCGIYTDMCQHSILKFMPIYGRDMYAPDPCGPEKGDKVDFFLNGMRVYPDQNIYFNFGDRIQIYWFTTSCVGVLGDLSGDGSVDITDLVIMVKFMFKDGPVWECRASGDFNGDGNVDISDLIAMVNKIKG